MVTRMPRFAANLSMLYPELAFLDRLEAAARDGFAAVEYLLPGYFLNRQAHRDTCGRAGTAPGG